MTSRFKVAQISPWLKKPGFEPGDPASYRPIANLNSIGKVLERLFVARLVPHVSGLYCSLQSAYRRHHSTETALLKMSNDIFEAVDSGISIVLVALDLSAAFHTIDHSVLINSLEYTLGLGVLPFNESSLISGRRTSFVKIGGERSATTGVVTGVPQGSVLGPILFSLYGSPLSNAISKHGIQFHQYADDIQLYIAVNVNNASHASMDLSECTSDIYDASMDLSECTSDIYDASTDLSVRLTFMTGCYTIASHSTRTSRNLPCSERRQR